MKKLLVAFLLVISNWLTAANAASFASCGPGYVLESAGAMDGIPTSECKKLWCRDLETGALMGAGDRANAGYKTTPSPVELCAANGTCIECFGDRKWCAGSAVGRFDGDARAYVMAGNPESRATRNGDCFAFAAPRPECAENQVQIMRNGRWICAAKSSNIINSRGPSVSRTAR